MAQLMDGTGRALWSLPYAILSSQAVCVDLVKVTVAALTQNDASPVGNEVLSGALDGGLRVFDMCGRLRETAHLHAAPVSSCRYSRGGAHLVSCGQDGSALIVDAFDWSVVGRWVSSSSLTAIDSANIQGGYVAFGDECGEITQLSSYLGICGRWRSF